MKQLLILIAFLQCVCTVQGQIVQKTDTLYLNAHIANGSGYVKNPDRGIRFFWDADSLYAESLVYKNDYYDYCRQFSASYSLALSKYIDYNDPLNSDFEMLFHIGDSIQTHHLLSFFNRNKNACDVKHAVGLSAEQTKKIARCFEKVKELKHQDRMIIRTSTSYYVLQSNQQLFVWKSQDEEGEAVYREILYTLSP